MNIGKTIRQVIAVAGLAWMGSMPMPSQASVVIGATRVIYPATEPEVTLRLTNPGPLPALVQAWVDSGDVSSAPSNVHVPFIVTPPMSRIDPSKTQTLRIIYTGEPLATDRESVFWLNVLDIPPKPGAEEADSNKIQLAFRSRIKLFFRPGGLQGKPEEAPAQLSWKLVQKDGKLAIQTHNPTPFHVSLTEVHVHSGSQIASFDEGDMVGPGKTRVFLLKGLVTNAPGTRVRHRSLNDYGGPIDGETLLSPDARTSPP
jgi:chaperone protein EcpD